MASILLGGIVTAIKGKVGGSVFKGSRSGQVLQNKQSRSAAAADGGVLTKADAGRVINPRLNLGATATQWRALSDSDRATWNAAAISFPFINKYGEPYTGSGYQLYMQCNANLLNIGESPIATAPTPAPVDNCPAFTISDAAGPGHQLEISIPGNPGYHLTLYATSNLSLGRVPQPGMFKAIWQADLASSWLEDITDEYVAVFGTLPSSGNLWFQGWVTEQATGRMGQPYSFQYVY